ncbi:MAG: hypothetical protein O3C60_03265 [Planctomycetota bacterium]|nr:hypothetical protein [Planctomycetota bacterium]
MRTALSLLEVILALAILATAATLLSQLMQLGLRSAAVARDEPRAVLWCESRLEELSAGILAPISVADIPLPEDDAWVYSIDVRPGAYVGLLEAIANVKRKGQLLDTASVTMTRWIIDPSDSRFQTTASTTMDGGTAAQSSNSNTGSGTDATDGDAQ